jgi:hypothetical protein
MKLKYPVYIISKGRAEVGTTRKAFESMGMSYKIVIEPQEYSAYSEHINPDNILVLPFSNLGQGSIPARNWVMEHSISIGAERHWIFDDNISRFCRLNKNRRIPVADGTIFRCMEDFTDRYENIALSGPNYRFFAPERSVKEPYILNWRVYSMILINNKIDHRWRGRYNEDTDLSLRLLKDGWCTIVFNAFLGDKLGTMIMKGGNTDHVYVDEDKRKKFAESLRDQHPDVVKVIWRFDRWHHDVNYKPFKNNKLIKKKGLIIPKCVNNYGMKLKRIGELKNVM